MSTLRVAVDGQERTVVLGGSHSTTLACLRAQLEAQGVPASIVQPRGVRPKLYPRSKELGEHFALARSRRRTNHCLKGEMLEEVPAARRWHDASCRWRTGKGAEPRGWECSPSCEIPEMRFEEAVWDE